MELYERDHELTPKEIINLFFNACPLNDYEIGILVNEYEIESKFLNEEHRWHDAVRSLCKYDNQYFCIDWRRGKVEDIEHEYPNQPIRLSYVVNKQRTIVENVTLYYKESHEFVYEEIKEIIKDACC